jgi:hypothetical protein
MRPVCQNGTVPHDDDPTSRREIRIGSELRRPPGISPEGVSFGGEWIETCLLGAAVQGSHQERGPSPKRRSPDANHTQQ